MRWITVLALMALTACGADGEPEPFLGAGVSIGSGGVSVGGAIGASNGPFTVAVGF